MTATSIWRAAMLVALIAPEALSQTTSWRRSDNAGGLRWPVTGGVSTIQMRPRDEFAANVGFGYGLQGTGTVGLDPWGVLRLRASFGGVWYGNEWRRVPLSETIGGRVTVKLVTNNMVYLGDIGPEIGVPWGPVRPYYQTGWGFQYFSTNSHIEGNDDLEDHFNTHNFDDNTGARHDGAGVRIDLAGRRTPVPVLLDIGVTRYRGGHAQYLRPGSISDLPDGSIVVSPLETPIRFTTVRIGVTIGR